MSNEVKVSVIIPVFNAQRYLDECFDSIQGQTLKEIEIICVDDGSTDESVEMLRKRQENDSRIRILQQKNAGPGAARNTGFRAAEGDYVIFWDADDFFEPEALEELYGKITEDQADVCVCNGYTYYEEEAKAFPSNTYLNVSKVPDEIPFSIRTNPEHICDFTSVTVWNKMFRRAFIAGLGLEFTTLHTSEDVNYVLNALCRAETVTVVDKRLVTYRAFQQGSLSADMVKAAGDLVEAFAVTAEELIRDNAFPERSFANRALAAVLTSLARGAEEWTAYRDVYRLLQDGGLEKMHILRQPEGYYYEKSKERCVEKLYTATPEEFAVFYLHEQTLRLRTQSGRVREQARKIGELRTERAELKNSLKNEREKERELQEKNAVLRERIRKLKESREYKLGRILTFIPRKIKELWKKLTSH